MTVISLLACEDRPREKLRAHGLHSLSNSELLALVIGSGVRAQSAVIVAQKVLHQSDNKWHKMAQQGSGVLQKTDGIGPVKASILRAVLEIGKRMNQELEGLAPEVIGSSKDGYRRLKTSLAHLTHEEFWVLFLSQSHAIQSVECLSKGGLTGTVADLRLIFARALEHRSTAIVLAHNHPSGRLQPSSADLQLTKKARAAGEILDVTVLDHLILTNNGYFSFADEGLMH